MASTSPTSPIEVDNPPPTAMVGVMVDEDASAPVRVEILVRVEPRALVPCPPPSSHPSASPRLTDLARAPHSPRDASLLGLSGPPPMAQQNLRAAAATHLRRVPQSGATRIGHCSTPCSTIPSRCSMPRVVIHDYCTAPRVTSDNHPLTTSATIKRYRAAPPVPTRQGPRPSVAIRRAPRAPPIAAPPRCDSSRSAPDHQGIPPAVIERHRAAPPVPKRQTPQASPNAAPPPPTAAGGFAASPGTIIQLKHTAAGSLPLRRVAWESRGKAFAERYKRVQEV